MKHPNVKELCTDCAIKDAKIETLLREKLALQLKLRELKRERNERRVNRG